MGGETEKWGVESKMMTSLPTSMNGVPVHLETITEPIAKGLADSVWSMMERYADVGLWKRIKDTIKLDTRTLKQLHKAIRMRIYMRAWDNILHIRITEHDGFCFRWIANPNDPAYAGEIARTYKERIEKKLELNKVAKNRRSTL